MTHSHSLRAHSVGGLPLVFLMACVAMLGGCVSKGKYDKVVAEKEALRAQNQSLAETTVRVAGVNRALREEVILLDMEVNQLAREQSEIEAELEDLIVAGSIRMQMLKDGLLLTMSDDLLFPSGSASLKSGGRDVLKDLVDELEGIPYQIVVIGNSDNTPIGAELAKTFPSNWDLAGARATSVVRVMEEEGIPSAQLVAVSFGDTRPVASNDTAEGRASNRRIEVRLRPVIRNSPE